MDVENVRFDLQQISNSPRMFFGKVEIVKIDVPQSLLIHQIAEKPTAVHIVSSMDN